MSCCYHHWLSLQLSLFYWFALPLLASTDFTSTPSFFTYIGKSMLCARLVIVFGLTDSYMHTTSIWKPLSCCSTQWRVSSQTSAFDVAQPTYIHALGGFTSLCCKGKSQLSGLVIICSILVQTLSTLRQSMQISVCCVLSGHVECQTCCNTMHIWGVTVLPAL